MYICVSVVFALFFFVNDIRSFCVTIYTTVSSNFLRHHYNLIMFASLCLPSNAAFLEPTLAQDLTAVNLIVSGFDHCFNRENVIENIK